MASLEKVQKSLEALRICHESSAAASSETVASKTEDMVSSFNPAKFL